MSAHVDAAPYSARALARELGLIFGIGVLYYLARGFARGKRETAERNARLLIEAEQRMGIYWEPAWQRAILDKPWLVDAANVIYFWAHLPLLAPFAAAMYLLHRGWYRLLRNTWLFSQVLGIAGYFLFPVSPPRLMPKGEFGYVDTLTERHEINYELGGFKLFMNEYAAFPSLHYGWSLLISMGLWGALRSPWARLAAFLWPWASLWSIVATANHYILDGVAGLLDMVVAAVAAVWVRGKGPPWLTGRRGDLRRPTGPGKAR